MLDAYVVRYNAHRPHRSLGLLPPEPQSRPPGRAPAALEDVSRRDVLGGLVRAVSLAPGDTVVVSGAAGGVGSLAVQLAVDAGATVIGLASEVHHGWLLGHSVVPVSYGDGVAERIRDASGQGIDAFIDTYGGGYVEMAIGLGVSPDRIDTIIDRAAAEKYGTKADGTAAAATTDVLSELARLIAEGRLEVPIARTYPMTQVREAYRELERRHTLGKIVLEP